jgi:FkbM family methyltransferase
MISKLLDLAYYGEVFFSRIQGIASGNPSRNGEYRLIRCLRDVVNFAVDGGANRGDWTTRLLAETKGRAEVACVEPDPRNVELIRLLFQGQANVTVHQAALSDSIGSASFLAGEDEGCGSGHLVSASGPSSFEVATVTLDELSHKHDDVGFDLVKLDVEGAEISALLGAERLFRSSMLGTIQIEYNSTWLLSGRRLKELFEFALDHGYALLAATPFGFAHYPRYGEGLEDYRMRNFVLARADHLPLLKPIAASGRAKVEARRAIRSSHRH